MPTSGWLGASAVRVGRAAPEFAAGPWAALGQTYARLVYLDPNHGPALLALAELSNALGRTDDAKRYQARLKRLSDS